MVFILSFPRDTVPAHGVSLAPALPRRLCPQGVFLLDLEVTCSKVLV